MKPGKKPLKVYEVPSAYTLKINRAQIQFFRRGLIEELKRIGQTKIAAVEETKKLMQDLDNFLKRELRESELFTTEAALVQSFHYTANTLHLRLNKKATKLLLDRAASLRSYSIKKAVLFRDIVKESKMILQAAASLSKCDQKIIALTRTKSKETRKKLMQDLEAVTDIMQSLRKEEDKIDKVFDQLWDTTHLMRGMLKENALRMIVSFVSKYEPAQAKLVYYYINYLNNVLKIEERNIDSSRDMIQEIEKREKLITGLAERFAKTA